MIAEEYLSRSRLYRRLRNGSHGELVDQYAARLVEVGLAHQRTCRSLRLVKDLLSWIANSRSVLTDLDERMVDRYLHHRTRKQSIQTGDRLALKRWLSVLRDAGTIAPPALSPITPQDQILAGFGDYLQRERGLAPGTFIKHLPKIRRFLCEVCPVGTGDLGKSARPTSCAMSSATPGTGVRSRGKSCARRCAHFSDTFIINGCTRSFWTVACLRSENGSLQTCRPIYAPNRSRMFSMVAIEQPLLAGGTTPYS